MSQAGRFAGLHRPSIWRVSPPNCCEQLSSAVRDGEKDRLDELIAAVAKEDPQSAGALKDLADKYEYDTLTSLLTEATQ